MSRYPYWKLLPGKVVKACKSRINISGKELKKLLKDTFSGTHAIQILLCTLHADDNNENNSKLCKRISPNYGVMSSIKYRFLNYALHIIILNSIFL